MFAFQGNADVGVSVSELYGASQSLHSYHDAHVAQARQRWDVTLCVCLCACVCVCVCVCKAEIRCGTVCVSLCVCVGAGWSEPVTLSHHDALVAQVRQRSDVTLCV